MTEHLSTIGELRHRAKLFLGAQVPLPYDAFVALLDVAEAAKHRGQCHGSLCECDKAIRAALDRLDAP
jgi:hypothetical protein